METIDFYKRMLSTLRRKRSNNDQLFLCLIAIEECYLNIKLFQDLKNRLSNIDKTDPDLWKISIPFKANVKPKIGSLSGSGFWSPSDFESRSTFLERIIKSLE
jgi:hypothetical protein